MVGMAVEDVGGVGPCSRKFAVADVFPVTGSRVQTLVCSAAQTPDQLSSSNPLLGLAVQAVLPPESTLVESQFTEPPAWGCGSSVIV